MFWSIRCKLGVEFYRENHTMRKIGLALGGGAVLGAAHIGVLRAIEEQNIKIDYISGTSIGAFVASFISFGKTWKELEQVANKLKWTGISGLSLSKYGLISNEKLGELLIEHLGDKNIEDALIPLSIVVTDITNGEKIILNKGSVAKAVLASTAIPGVFQPVNLNDRILVDGGVVENVPTATVRKMGAEYVIGVDLNAFHHFQTPTNIFDIIINSFHFLIQKSDRLQTQDADLLIKPDLSEYNWTNMSQIKALMERGYKDSILALKAIDSSTNFLSEN